MLNKNNNKCGNKRQSSKESSSGSSQVRRLMEKNTFNQDKIDKLLKRVQKKLPTHDYETRSDQTRWLIYTSIFDPIHYSIYYRKWPAPHSARASLPPETPSTPLPKIIKPLWADKPSTPPPSIRSFSTIKMSSFLPSSWRATKAQKMY